MRVSVRLPSFDSMSYQLSSSAEQACEQEIGETPGASKHASDLMTDSCHEHFRPRRPHAALSWSSGSRFTYPGSKLFRYKSVCLPLVGSQCQSPASHAAKPDQGGRPSFGHASIRAEVNIGWKLVSKSSAQSDQ